MADDVTTLAQPLDTSADLDPLLRRIGDSRFVLLGEASHGTHEYYAWRAEITRRLIEEKDFAFVAVEGDWPDCYRVSRSVLGDVDDDPRDVLNGFERWPTWMWANEEVADFTRWLRARNAEQPVEERVGFYGLDVYSLWDSLRAVLGYLEEHEPEHAEAARQAFSCFEPYKEDPQNYAWATLVPQTCEREVLALLRGLCEQGADGGDGRDARFNAEQNAAVAVGAERYYRAMIQGSARSWNIRDEHMADTLDRLVAHHTERLGRPAKAVVWEHNTHIGDARYTDMAEAGMFNVGQLVRERHGEEGVVLVGFGGYAGSVVAGERWGGDMRRMPMPPARRESVEALLHERLVPETGQALFVFPHPEDQPRWLREERAHRAIGVVYSPHQERWGNYVPTVLGSRYDAFLWFDRAEALQPLHASWAGTAAEPEAYPSGV